MFRDGLFLSRYGAGLLDREDFSIPCLLLSDHLLLSIVKLSKSPGWLILLNFLL